MNTLLILNDPPYGIERCYNPLRLAHTLIKKEPDAEFTVFLMADAVVAARKGQKTPDGYYNMERIAEACSHEGHRIALRNLHGRARHDRRRRHGRCETQHHGRTRGSDLGRRQGSGVLSLAVGLTRLL